MCDLLHIIFVLNPQKVFFLLATQPVDDVVLSYSIHNRNLVSEYSRFVPGSPKILAFSPGIFCFLLHYFVYPYSRAFKMIDVPFLGFRSSFFMLLLLRTIAVSLFCEIYLLSRFAVRTNCE